MIFDSYIQKTIEFVSANRTDITLFDGKNRTREKTLADFIRHDNAPNIILRHETFLELGRTSDGSCAFVLPTNQPDLVHDGQITLLGPDIPESEGRSLPFAQALIAGGESIQEDDLEEIREVQFIDGLIDGFMVRSLFESIWCRISNDAARKGFNFETLGRIMLNHARQACNKIEVAEVVFLTTDREDLRFFNGINDQVRKINKEFRNETWKIKGYDVDCSMDCESCVDKSACDDIREVLREQHRQKQAKLKER